MRKKEIKLKLLEKKTLNEFVFYCAQTRINIGLKKKALDGH